MSKFLPAAVLVGLVAGLLVGGLHFFFTVPVIERSIAWEEQSSADAAKAQGMVMEEEKPLVSLGAQKNFTIVGFGLIGVVMGVVFTGVFGLVRLAAPRWPALGQALAAGALGYWAITLLPFIKYPLNPPGVGSEETLLFRQGFQFLFLGLSVAGMAAVLLAARQVNRKTAVAAQRGKLYGLLVLAYLVYAAVIFTVVPGNPDPVEVPIDLLQLFRVLSIIGWFLLWGLLSAGVGLVVMRRQRADLESKRAGTVPAGSSAGPARR
ncbi:MAG: hypothetical protein EXR54_07365 [Dehalococcoidia bacterium]|nr:hypothetical protein [Dehalococcoidia bacterium]MSQ17368.1 hypothetical protein [Dehalococcoidia bacterium]